MPGYRLTLFQRALNTWVKLWVRVGLPPRRYHLMTVPGRRSKRLLSNPVSVLVEGGQRWVVCPYGEREWVKNVRAAGQITLSRGLSKTEAHGLGRNSTPTSAPLCCGPTIEARPLPANTSGLEQTQAWQSLPLSLLYTLYSVFRNLNGRIQTSRSELKPRLLPEPRQSYPCC